MIFERFFDESGGMQLVIHSPFGSRVNRAWGLSLRKRFCRTFNFELQAAATEDHIVLSLTHAHSFELAEAARYLNSNSVRQVLVQALCAAPMFEVRWRWDAGIALALPRFRGGKKIPPQIARMNAEDLLASVFPDQVACAENLPGEIEIPDHPLVRQTIRDCLEDAMDIDRFEAVLRRLESGEIRVVARDLTEPSPLALEALNARPYAYLDDAPLEERRTQAVMSRRWLDPADAADIGKLDPEAIARVRAEAWPDAATADELHDALLWLTFLTDEEVNEKCSVAAIDADLAAQRRVVRIVGSDAARWVAAERRALFEPALRRILVGIVRGRLEGLGPVTSPRWRPRCRLRRGPDRHRAGRSRGRGGRDARPLQAGAARGTVVRAPIAGADSSLHRQAPACRNRAGAGAGLSALSVRMAAGLPKARMQGSDALAAVLSQLEGFEAPAGAGRPRSSLRASPSTNHSGWMSIAAQDDSSGRDWRRAAGAPRMRADRGTSPVRSTPIVLLARRHVPLWSALVAPADPAASDGSKHGRWPISSANMAHRSSRRSPIRSACLPVEVEEALAELVALGMVNSDSFAGLRVLLMPSGRRGRSTCYSGRHKRRLALFGMADAGRWALVRRPNERPPSARTRRSNTSCARCCAAGA